MRWIFVSSVLLLGIGSIPAHAGHYGRTFYSSCYTPYYYPTYSYYKPYYPTYSYSPPKYTAPAAPAYSTDWKTAAVDFAKAKDDYALFQRTMQEPRKQWPRPMRRLRRT